MIRSLAPMRRSLAPMIRLAPLAIAALMLHVASANAQGAFPAPLPNGSSAAPANNASPFPPVGGAQRSSPFPPVNGAPASAPTASSSPFPPVGGGAPASQTSFPSGGAAPIAGSGAGGLSAPPSADGGGGAGAGAACLAEFKPLRDENEKRGKAIKAASDRKASAQEACGLITSFSQAELKLLKYVFVNQKRCGIPPEVPEQMKQGRGTTEKLLKQVCSAAKQQQAGPAGPAAPSLSEALGSVSVPEASKTKRGGSTFDTLNGNVLAR